MLRKTTTVLRVAGWGVPSYVFREQPVFDGTKSSDACVPVSKPHFITTNRTGPRSPSFTLRQTEDRYVPGLA